MTAAEGPAEGPVRVLVVDDHPLFRAGVRAALQAEAGIVVVDEADDGAAALERMGGGDLDVVLLDLAMPGTSGLEVLRARRGRAAEPAVVVLTMHDDDVSVLAALREGAAGYLLKGSPRAGLVAAVRAAVSGTMTLDAAAAPALRAALTTGRGRTGSGHGLAGLTEREQQVAELLAGGAGNAAIARQLVLSEKTVRNLVSSVVAKLGAHDRGHAGAIARQAGFG